MTVVSDFTSLITGWSWAGYGATGKSAFVTYSFETSPAGYLSDPNLGFNSAFLSSFQPLTGVDLSYAQQALHQWEAQSGVKFLQVPSGEGQIRFGLYNFDLLLGFTQFGGFAYGPNVAVDQSGAYTSSLGGDVFLNTQRAPVLSRYLHEIGHAIGFKHPFEGDPTLNAALDTRANTTMSYTGNWEDYLGYLDIQAVQYAYGKVDGAHLTSWSWDPATLTLTQIDGDDADTLIGVSVGDIIRGHGGNDIIAGFDGDDMLDGGADDDILFGGGGADTLLGGAGNDTLVGGAGADTLQGQAGIDTASYAAEAGAVGARLDGLANFGAATGDVIDGVENLVGSAFNDILVGSNDANTLDGGAGNDTLWGGAGNDTLIGGAGADTLYGQAGIDTASYAGASAGVDARLNVGHGFAGEAAGDTLVAVENLTGSAFNDVLLGNGLDNVISGGGGADYLAGGNGIDTASYADAGARIDARLNVGHGFAGEAAGDTLVGFENLTGSAYNDVLFGDGGDNVLSGGAGADFLRAGAGDDTLIGGASADFLDGWTGNDTVSYANASARVDARLNAGTGFAGDATGDSYSGIENLTGSAYGDTLYGNAGDNVLSGGAGADAIAAGAGDDTLIGGAGADALSGWTGDDRIEGGTGNDLLIGGAGDDLFVFHAGDGADVIVGFIAGAGSEDVIFFDNGAASPDSFADVQAAASQVGADTVIDLGGGDSITLLNVTATDLHADDFLF